MALLLIWQHERLDETEVAAAIRRVFDARATHAIPRLLPFPPLELAVAYRREAERVGVASELLEAHAGAARWLDPVLARLT